MSDGAREAHLTVRLLAATPDAEGLAAAAARLCYARDAARILQRDAGGDRDLLDRILGSGHLSVIEHVTFTFLVEGVSRALTHQLVRHRVASYSQRSQRYVTHRDFAYVIPPRLRGRTIDTPDGPVDAVAFYEETMAILAARYERIREAIGAGGEEANEDARYVLPNACETKIVVTMNARELLHVFQERLCLRAQWEIRALAARLLEIVRPLAPSIFRKAGPKCVRLRRCPEGRRTCGRFLEILAEYGEEREGARIEAPAEEETT
ncbi:MAG: FAD-dependent thymidylate synthase [Planctomycetes bacterium]|nr:FAD-dependent thymidylate synthase [Planctomycetota bacterium]